MSRAHRSPTSTDRPGNSSRSASSGTTRNGAPPPSRSGSASNSRRRGRDMSLEIKQSATYKGGDRWDWSVWVDGTKAEMEKVRSVTYRLHETFPDPVRVRTSRSEKFRLDSSGWGEFTILVNIDAGGKKIVRRHYLKLEESKIAQPQAATEPVS